MKYIYASDLKRIVCGGRQGCYQLILSCVSDDLQKKKKRTSLPAPAPALAPAFFFPLFLKI